MVPWYDRKETIEEKIRTLEGLNELITARMDAVYKRGENLNHWYILGRFALSGGNLGKIDGYIPKDDLPFIPDVLSETELFEYLQLTGRDPDTRIGYNIGNSIPPAKMRCPVCGTGWHILNCHDAVIETRHPVIPLYNFAEQTLGQVENHLNKSREAVYRLQRDSCIRNDRFIDLSSRYPNSKEYWPKNQYGWVGEEEGVDRAYVVKPGDEGGFTSWSYYHTACYQHDRAQRERDYFEAVFAEVGIKTTKMVAIPNGYSNDPLRPPWFVVYTDLGVITIGWRKHVISISLTPAFDVDLRSLFAKENVTKGDTYIHADSREKAVEYLKRIQLAAIAR